MKNSTCSLWRRLARPLTALLAVVTLSAAFIAASPAALATDKITLKDGRVLEGDITREEGGYVWFKASVGGIAQDMFLKPDEISSIERDAASTPTPGTPVAAAADKSKPSAAPRTSGATRVAILTLGEKPEKEMVGMYITAKSLKDAIPLLEEDGVEVVVLRINSGGGLGLEVQRLSDVIEFEMKPKFRVVSWIEWAISAAAMTSHAVPEIYFTPQGAYGACTGWYGALQAVKDRPLESMLFEMEKISARGGYDPKIMRAMQILDAPLSATIDENGEVQFYGDETSGAILVNPKEKILTLTAEEAMQIKFSKGTAATHQELAKLMGLNEVEWVGEPMAGVPWPVSRADKLLRKFRDQTSVDEKNTQAYFAQYELAVANAQSEPEKKDRAKFVNLASGYLDKIERMGKNNPNIVLLLGAMPDEFKDWLSQQREMLKRLLK